MNISKLTLCILLIFTTSKVINAQETFSKYQLDYCNTAKDVAYLTSNEKEVIQLINLARSYPNLFCKVYINKLTLHYYDSTYIISLKKELIAASSVALIIPDINLYNTAKCWAIEAGINNIRSHQRINCKYEYSAECISFSKSNALDIVLDLLVDWGVPSLGHRHALLDSYYSKIGVAIQAHKTTNYIAVLDFY